MTTETLCLADFEDWVREEIVEVLGEKGSPSVFEDFDDYLLLKIRRLDLHQSDLAFNSEIFILKGDQVFLYDSQSEVFSRMPSGFAGMVSHLESFYKINKKIITGYADEITNLENNLFERAIPTYFMDLWFDLKKDLARIENYYFRNSMVYREFFRKCEEIVGDWVEEFRDIDDMITFQTAHVGTLKLRMDSVHHYYASVKSDRLNRTLLVLTMISGIFLPLNLIVGFFGMNTKGLFLEADPHGTRTVVIILGSILVVLLLGAPFVKLLDRLLLQRLLGRYDLYRSVAQKVGKLDEQIRPQI